MKIKWRQHENILAIAVAIFFIISLLIRGAEPSRELNPLFNDQRFVDAGFPFLYTRNVLMPDLLFTLTLLFGLLIINYLIIRRLISRSRYLFIIAASILLVFLMSTGIGFASYFWQQYRYHSPTQPNRLMLMAFIDGFILCCKSLFFYSLYIFTREIIINFLEKNNNGKPYRVLVANTTTMLALIYFILFFFAVFFKIFQNNKLLINYSFFTPPFLITILACLYGFFPFKEKTSFSLQKVMLTYLGLILAICLPFDFLFIIAMQEGEKFNIFLFISCGLQIFAATPIAWLLYREQKEKIATLRGLQTELGRSRANLDFLRSQINPHFLFNVLNTLYGTALQEQATKTAEGVQRLGDMMRFMLQENMQKMISLQREVEYLENYISLQKLRTQSSPAIQIDRHIDTIYGDHRIAPMLLIPFVENAFKHGISLQEPSFIRIGLQLKKNILSFDVVNSIHRKQLNDTEKQNNGIGLQNVQQRLALLYPHKHELVIRENGKDYFIHLTIQLS